ncbi:hypothetical protein GUJ93_ZPchr0007g3528 [Zizania palustris]|uniref:Uncharacterized protein n=1 Tax=Zizania palustris TaxID=103762 RepID=A0A8J5STR8_ZIZPA|nr:hypothetical protein GUJ93_ZPchr0007g3528 [Zizania palustris]
MIDLVSDPENVLADFILAELKTMRAKKRWPFRDKSHKGAVNRTISYEILAQEGESPIITFNEFINIALSAERVVEIYPEMKNRVFINKQVKWADGKTYEKFIAALKSTVMAAGTCRRA